MSRRAAGPERRSCVGAFRRAGWIGVAGLADQVHRDPDLSPAFAASPTGERLVRGGSDVFLRHQSQHDLAEPEAAVAEPGRDLVLLDPVGLGDPGAHRVLVCGLGSAEGTDLGFLFGLLDNRARPHDRSVLGQRPVDLDAVCPGRALREASRSRDEGQGRSVGLDAFPSCVDPFRCAGRAVGPSGSR